MLKQIGLFLASLPRELYVFIISMLPVVELRGAIPAGAAFGLPVYANLPLAVIGNLVPIPFILAFMPKILHFIAKFKPLTPIVEWIRNKADKYKGRIIKSPSDAPVESSAQEAANDETIESGEQIPTEEEVRVTAELKPKKGKRRLSTPIFLAMIIFVGFPLPGTGAWTGALVASIFKLPKRSSFLAITLGVLLSGLIMCLTSYGVMNILSSIL